MQTYFFSNNINSYIKIGKSIAPKSRLQQISGQCPFVKISILHIIDGDFESHFQRLYSENRVCGEWFDIPQLTVEIIEQNLLKITSCGIL